MHITPEMKLISDTILLYYIYLTQQKYLCDGNKQNEWSDSQQNYQCDDSNGNMPRDTSDDESDDKKF